VIVVAIVINAVAIANTPVIINNHLLFVKIVVIAKTIVVRTIDATTTKATLLIALAPPISAYSPNAHETTHRKGSANPYLFSLSTRSLV